MFWGLCRDHAAAFPSCVVGASFCDPSGYERAGLLDLILLRRSVGRGVWHHRRLQHSLRSVVNRDDAIAINHAVVADDIAPVPGWQTESDYRRGKVHFARSPMTSSIDGVGQS